MTPTARDRRIESLVLVLERHVVALDDPAPEVRSFIDRAIADPESIADDELESFTVAASVWSAVDLDLLRRARIQPAIDKRRQLAAEKAEEARRLTAAGLTNAQISAKTGVTPRQVQRRRRHQDEATT